MYQILLVPNITWQKNIDQDSYVQVISEIIGELNKIREDLFWHCPLPKHSKLLDYDNVKQYYFDIPTYPNSMRGRFNYADRLKIVDWKNQSFDLIYSHLPEWTTNVVNLLSNVTNIGDIPVVGYTHWTEIKEITTYSRTYLLNNINWLLEMKQCGVNTNVQKKLIINNVKCMYSEETLNKLDNILTPQYIGVKHDLIRENICESPEKTIVFNHRPQAYKNFPHFLTLMAKLWKYRQDFKVWIPLMNKTDVSYIDTSSYTKQGYYDRLHNCSICYCPKQKYAGWSVSGTDALMNGVPVLFYNDVYYHELRGDGGDYHHTDAEAIDYFNSILDNIDYRNTIARDSLKYCKNVLSWDNRIHPINDMINDGLAENKCVTDRSKRIHDIIDYIERNKCVTKKQILDFIGWGVGIKFNRYRKTLLEHDNITTRVSNKIEYYCVAGHKLKEIFSPFL